MNPITDIAFEQIGSTKYYWAQYGPFRVIMDRTTGYINATQLCGLAINKNGNRKEFKEWSRHSPAQEIVNEVAASAFRNADDLLTVVTGGQITEIRGTYAHPDLIPHIAAWASPKFAVMVSRIVNAHLVREYRESIRAKDTRIDELIRKVDAQSGQITSQTNELRDQKRLVEDQSRQIAELLGYAKETKSTLDHIVVQNDSLLQEARETSIAVECLEYQVERATESIDTILPNKTVTPPSKSIQYFCLYSHSTATTRFYAVRGQQTNLDRARPKLIGAGYALEPIYSREDPNPFHSFNTLKRLLDEGARALLQQKRARGRYTLKNAIEEFGSYHLNVITCSRDRLDSLLEELDRLRAAMDE